VDENRWTSDEDKVLMGNRKKDIEKLLKRRGKQVIEERLEWLDPRKKPIDA